MSKSTLKNKDEVSIYGHGTDGGRKSPQKLKWNSTKAQSVSRARAEVQDGGIRQGSVSQTDYADEYSDHDHKKLQRKLINIYDVERYCKPQ